MYFLYWLKTSQFPLFQTLLNEFALLFEIIAAACKCVFVERQRRKLCFLRRQEREKKRKIM